SRTRRLVARSIAQTDALDLLATISRSPSISESGISSTGLLHAKPVQAIASTIARRPAVDTRRISVSAVRGSKPIRYRRESAVKSPGPRPGQPSGGRAGTNRLAGQALRWTLKTGHWYDTARPGARTRRARR